MSARFKKRKRHVDDDLNLLPIMNLFMVLIPFLLLSTVFVKTAVIDIYLPQATPPPKEKKKPDKKPLEMLTINVTEAGFSFSGLGKNIGSVPKSGDDYNYSTLSTKLMGLKNKYPESSEVVLLFVADAPYETVVMTMDASREMVANGVTTKLFPNVSIGTYVKGGK